MLPLAHTGAVAELRFVRLMRNAVRYGVSIVALLCISEVRPVASPVHAPKTGFVTANGIKLHYLDWGGSGDPICFFPASTTVHMYTINSLCVLPITFMRLD